MSEPEIIRFPKKGNGEGTADSGENLPPKNPKPVNPPPAQPAKKNNKSRTS